MTRMEIGAPVALSDVLGRVLSVDGGTRIIITPHGSTIKAGVFWLDPISDGYRLARLEWLEADAVRRGLDPYKGAFAVPVSSELLPRLRQMQPRPHTLEP